ncbi:MAG: ABC transporter ATP-binding protein [Gammaproteobacteria bacterium]|nr:ABC transporter ATP-binding protein [Gammaproteobacteria bacterium]
MTTLLEARGLSVEIAGRRLVDALDLRIDTGQSWALLGRNGVGKSTLLHTLAGLRPASAGELYCTGDPLHGLTARERARRIAVLLQHSNSGFGTDVLECVLGGRHPHLGALAWEGPHDVAIAQRCLAATGASDLAGRRLDSLSGGELRRVEIARLLCQQTPLALLDEPLNHLDPGHQAALLQVLNTECVGPRHALLMVVHDLNVAWHACTHWLILHTDGRWQAGARSELATEDLLGTAFGHPIERIGTGTGPLFRTRL